MKNNRGRTQKNWQQLASLYKAKANYKTVFPKLPSMVKLYYSKWQVSQELVMIKDSISVDYYGLLKKFGKPSDDNITKNPGAAFQKESSAPPSDDAVALDEPTANAKRGISLEDAPESILPVAPFAAPAQKDYNESTDRRTTDTRKCSAAPFGCPNLAKDCSGRRRWRYCRFVATSSSIDITDKEAAKIILDHNNIQRNLKRIAERAAIKAAKEAAAARND